VNVFERQFDIVVGQRPGAMIFSVYPQPLTGISPLLSVTTPTRD